MDSSEYRFFYRRHLPHYQPRGATLFVTFRLAGSIPKALLVELEAEAERVARVAASMSNPDERTDYAYREQRRLFGRWDAALDSATTGPHWLQTAEIAAIVAESLHFLDGHMVKLDAYCIMPNHVHMVAQPLQDQDGNYYSLSRIMHSLKLFTARKANRVLNRGGAFWQQERYDHVVRDAGEWNRIVAYVLKNPVKAGLVAEWTEWPWTYYRDASVAAASTAE